MGFDDLKYGWFEETLDLKDIQIVTRVALEAPSQKYGWIARSPSLKGALAETEKEQREAAAEYDAITEVRYNRSRTVTAKAVSTGFDAVYVGVPADRKTTKQERESRVDHVDLAIIAAVDAPLSDCVAAGRVGYRKAYEEHKASVWLNLYVPADVFDEIERLAKQPGVEPYVSVTVRGWHWLGPVADSQLYIDTEKPERAELSCFGTRPVVADGPSREDLAHPPPETENTVESLLKSIRLAAWVTVGAIVVVAARILF